MVIYHTLGCSFNDTQPVESVQVGTMNIEFRDCGNALLGYSLDLEDVVGETAISRLIPGSQALCEEFSTRD